MKTFDMRTSLQAEETERNRPHWHYIYEAAFPNHADRIRAGREGDRSGTDMFILQHDDSIRHVQEKHVHFGYRNVCTETHSTWPDENGWSVAPSTCDTYIYLRPLPNLTCEDGNKGEALVFAAREFHEVYARNLPRWTLTEHHYDAHNSRWVTHGINVRDTEILPLLTTLQRIPITFGQT